jgi:hypothetical protein
MTPSFPENERKIFSQFTRSFLQDTTWYEVDAELFEDLIYGKNEGCEFAVDHWCGSKDLIGN